MELSRELTVEVPVKVTRERIADLLCSALEGGSTYWCKSVQVEDYGQHEWAHEAIAGGETGFTFEVFEEEGERHRVGAMVPVALRQLARDFPEQFQLWLEEQDDAETGDIFFQLMCFGEVVYG